MKVIVKYFSISLAGTALKWWKFRQDLASAKWEFVKTEFRSVFSILSDPNFALEVLIKRKHEEHEDFRKYVFDVIDLCHKTSDKMTDEQKAYFVLREMKCEATNLLSLLHLSLPQSYLNSLRKSI